MVDTIDTTMHLDVDVEANISAAHQSARSHYLGQISGCVGILRLMVGMILSLILGSIILYKLTNTEYTLDRAVEDISKLTNLIPMRTGDVGEYNRNGTTH